jgi:hypothetical protein
LLLQTFDVVHFVVVELMMMKQMFGLKVICEMNIDGNSCLLLIMATVCLMNHYNEKYFEYD